MKQSHFFAVLSRMKYINRWGLMRNTHPENLSEHSYEVAVIAHALCEIRNRRFGGNLDSARAALLSLFHDSTEIFTGDMPTPVKYFSPDIRQAYRRVEEMAVTRLLSYLPEDLKPAYDTLFKPVDADKPLIQIVKAADKLSALIKCIEEEKAGNSEFKAAADAQQAQLRELQMPEVDVFVEEFLPGYRLSLDEQERG